ncbi:transmembrane protease serine 9-like [Topomyia yanbarensis]|uniref:transmembrane protease serine 9-like n=1 Tax=Topomyia yanbarensis TaxID=2498891 RepID=UPI00273C89B9|nr:transmembrane protease serine 9-like [Topomyia yanbarensis]
MKPLGLMHLLVICILTGMINAKTTYDTHTQPAPRQQPTQRNPFLQWLASLIGTTTTTQAPPLNPPNNCTECKCGRINQATRIVGGTETRVNQYPWMAILQYGGTFYCGGSLISDRHVLTAAHCVHGFNPAKISVVLLEHDRSNTMEARTITSKVERVIKHNGYNPSNYNSDIAILKLDQMLKFDERLRPVCLPTAKKSFTGYDGIVTGWGATAENGAISVTLQEVIVPIMSNTDCRKSGYGEKRITDNMLCAGFPEGNKDSCQGDSGGPLHVMNKEKTMENIYQNAGIVSWGEGCAKPNYPGVYTRVNRFRTWIMANTVDGCFCSEDYPNYTPGTVGAWWLINHAITHYISSRYEQINHHIHMLSFRTNLFFSLQVIQEPEEAVPANKGNPFLEWLEVLTGIQRPGPPLKPAENCTECKCGRTNQVNRIVGGMETRVNQYPWMAILKYGDSFYCGGTLISDRHVMTAAHCVHGFNKQRISVTLLDHDRSSSTETETITSKVDKIYKHSGYSPFNYDNDIAILRLETIMQMNDKLRPVCQPSSGESFAGYDGIVTGWGTTTQGGDVSPTLQEVSVPILSNEECRKSAYGEKRITDNMLCAAVPEGGMDSCQGDSGGPLHIISKEMESESIHQLAGVVSWGEGCAKPDHPGVYTRVNRYEGWIRNNTIDGCYCTQ